MAGRRRPGGVFCLEGQWHRHLDVRGSVLPTLDLLERLGEIRFIHKDVATRDEFTYFLDRWLLRQYDEYRVGFFAMHGDRKRLDFSDHESMELDEITDLMRGRCDGKRLYFGSCSVMRSTDNDLLDFISDTGAALACGYTRTVNWVESAAFETILLDVLANSPRIDGTERALGSAQWAPLAAHLGFRIVYANRVWQPPAAVPRVRIPVQA
jgi:hypothetical protein